MRLLHPSFQKWAALLLPLPLALQGCSVSTDSDPSDRAQMRAEKLERIANMNAFEREEATMRVVYMVRNFCRDQDLTEEQIRAANDGEDLLEADSLACPQP